MRKILFIAAIYFLPMLAMAQETDDTGIYVGPTGEQIIVKEVETGIMVTNGSQVIPLMRFVDDTYMNPYMGLSCIIYDGYIMFGYTNGQMYMYKKWYNYTLIAQNARQIAMEKIQNMEWEEAIPYIEKAIENESKNDDINYALLAYDYMCLGNAYMYDLMMNMEVDPFFNYDLGDTSPITDNYAQSAIYYEKAGDHKSEAMVYSSLGLFYKNTRDYESAIDCFKKAAGIYEKIDEIQYAVQLSNISGCYSLTNDWDNANQYLIKGLNIMERNITTNDERIQFCSMLGLIGQNFVMLGRYDEAMQYYNQQYKLAQELENKPLIFGYYLNKAGVQMDMGQFDDAAETYKSAKAYLATDTQNDTEYASAQIDGCLGNLADAKGNMAEAALLYQKALLVFEKNNDIHSQVNTLSSLASIDFRKKDYNKTIETLTHSVDLIKASMKQNVSGMNVDAAVSLGRLYGRIMMNLSSAYCYQNQFSKAIENIEGCKNLAKQYNERRTLVNVYGVEAEIYYRMGDYNAAARSYLEANSYIDDIRKGVQNPKQQRDYLANMISNYRGLSMVYYRQQKVNEVFNTIETSSATIFGEQMAAKLDENKISYVHMNALQKQLGSNTAIIKYQFCLRDTSLCLVITNGIAKCVEFSPSKMIAEALLIINDKSIVKNAKSYNERGFVEIDNPNTAQSAVTSDYSRAQFEAIIKYYRYLLTKDISQLRGMVDVDTKPVATPLPTELNALSGLLYKHLLKPVLAQLSGQTELIIQPDGILAYLPFETLKNTNGPYLCEKYAIRYQQSVAVANMLAARFYNHTGPMLIMGGAIYQPENKNTALAKRSFAQFKQLADLALDRGGADLTNFYNQYAWPNLPGTLAEAKAIAQIEPDCKLITGADVTETNIKNLNSNGDLAKFRVAHFATHGLVVPEIPELSALVLSLSGDSQNDGFLNVDEIYKLNLKTEFVNLSACETGRGKIFNGEGVVGLTQAFLLAGAKSISVSLWSISDEGTSAFMIEMYKKVYNQKLSFSDAMLETKRDFIKGKFGAEMKNPYYWAPFVYYGVTNNDQVTFAKVNVDNADITIAFEDENTSAGAKNEENAYFEQGRDYFNAATALQRERDYESSIACFNASINAFKTVFIYNNQNTNALLNQARAYANIGDNYKLIYRNKEQVDAYKKVIDLYNQLYALTQQNSYKEYQSYYQNQISALMVPTSEHIQTELHEISLMEELLAFSTESAKVTNASGQNMTGVWTTTLSNYTYPVDIVWCIKPDNRSIYFMQSKEGKSIISGTYDQANNIVVERFEDHTSARGSIKWIDNNTFQLTIINSGINHDSGQTREYKRNTDKLFVDEKEQLSNNYGNLAWYYLLNKQFVEAEKAARKALSYNSNHLSVYANLAHALLLQNRFEEAKAVYSKYKNMPFPDDNSKTFSYYYKNDFEVFKAEGITHPDFEKIKTFL